MLDLPSRSLQAFWSIQPVEVVPNTLHKYTCRHLSSAVEKKRYGYILG